MQARRGARAAHAARAKPRQHEPHRVAPVARRRRAVGVHVLHRHRGPSKGPGRCRGARRAAFQGAVPENTRLLPFGMLIDPCELSPSYVRSIAPYQPGKPISELAREMGLDEAGIVKLASNENPRGIGPRTRAAIDAALGDIARYPDGNGFELKQALSARYGVDMSAIVLGNGSNDVLELAAAAFLGPGRAAVMSQHAFAVYPLATQARGARSIVVPAKNHGHDLETMARAIDDETYVVWVANPNNPTGTYARADEVEAFLRRVPERVLVVVDEAYNEYLPREPRAATPRTCRACASSRRARSASASITFRRTATSSPSASEEQRRSTSACFAAASSCVRSAAPISCPSTCASPSARPRRTSASWRCSRPAC